MKKPEPKKILIILAIIAAIAGCVTLSSCTTIPQDSEIPVPYSAQGEQPR